MYIRLLVGVVSFLVIFGADVVIANKAVFADIAPRPEQSSVSKLLDTVGKPSGSFLEAWGTVIAGCTLTLAIVVGGIIWFRRQGEVPTTSSKNNDEI